MVIYSPLLTLFQHYREENPPTLPLQVKCTDRIIYLQQPLRTQINRFVTGSYFTSYHTRSWEATTALSSLFFPLAEVKDDCRRITALLLFGEGYTALSTF